MSIIDLNQTLAIIEVSGEDSTTFLQNQLTNDVTLLGQRLENNCVPYQFAAHLNHKGRMLANFIVIQPILNTYYLISNRDLLTDIIPRLKMFVLRSHVNISLATQNIALSATALDNAYNIALDQNYYLSIAQDNLTMTTNLQPWVELLIAHGISLLHPATVDKLIPQQANLDSLNGISFSKGCYTGQEIVARTHYLGKIKRKLFKFKTNTSRVQIGQSVTSPSMNQQEVGVIVEALITDDEAYGLLSLQVDCQDSAFINQVDLLQITAIN